MYHKLEKKILFEVQKLFGSRYIVNFDHSLQRYSYRNATIFSLHDTAYESQIKKKMIRYFTIKAK